MLEDQVAYLLQRYLGNYVRGLNKEALKISVWQGDVELTNMQLKPEALNALKLPVKVKAGFLGSVKLKVPWSRLGQEPVLVYLDRIFLLAEPETHVEGSTEEAVQEAKRRRILEMEIKLLETAQHMNTEMNKSWLGSLVDTVIGNLRLSISNIHIRYEDSESNPGHPFAAGITLDRLSAVTIDDTGQETFVTEKALDQIRKSVVLERLAFYFDSDIIQWNVEKPWGDMTPSEWDKVFQHGIKEGKPSDNPLERHTYILQPVSGDAKYMKQRPNASFDGQPLQKSIVNLDDVTLCLSKNGYRDIIKLADNFSAFNQRLKYAHLRPRVSVMSDSRVWWTYAFKAIAYNMKKESGKLSWEQVLKLTRLRKKYISLYATLLKSDLSREVVDDDKYIQELDRGLDIDIILQWRMLAHKFVKQSKEYETCTKMVKSRKIWWPFGRNSPVSLKDESDPLNFSKADWERLNFVIGYKEGDDDQLSSSHDKGDVVHTALEIHMKHNASKLISETSDSLAELSCEDIDCNISIYSEAKIFDVKLGSYQLVSPNGLLAKSATAHDSFVGVFSYKPFDSELDWSMVAKASPCYMMYLKDSIEQIIDFFESSSAISQKIALDTAAALQMTLEEVKRTAQQQVNRALKNPYRFHLDLDIAAPKITIPTNFCPDQSNLTKLMLDLGNLVIRTQDNRPVDSAMDMNIYLQFDLVLSDVSAFLVDGEYHWEQSKGGCNFMPLLDNCGIYAKLQQIHMDDLNCHSTRIALRIPCLGIHFSPARYHRMLQVVKIFTEDDSSNSSLMEPI